MDAKTCKSEGARPVDGVNASFSILLITAVPVALFALFPFVLPHFLRCLTKLLVSESDDERKLRKEIVELKIKLQTIHMVDEFAKYAKVERQIIKLSEQKKNYDERRNGYSTRIKLACSVGFQIFKVLFMVILIWCCKDAPVLILPQTWNRPIGAIIALPSNVHGGVGIVFWYLVCNASVSRILKILKIKRGGYRIHSILGDHDMTSEA